MNILYNNEYILELYCIIGLLLYKSDKIAELFSTLVECSAYLTDLRRQTRLVT